MTKIYGREAALILLSGVLGLVLVPGLLGHAPATILFWVGLLMGLTYAPLWAMGRLAGRKMPVRVRNWMGVLIWMALFGNDFAFTGNMLTSGIHLTFGSAVVMLAPGLAGLILALLAAVGAPAGKRGLSALEMLFAYSMPMLGVLWILTSMVKGIAILPEVARILGAAYMTMHGLIQLYVPSLADGIGDQPTIRRHPVPDAIVGLVESQTKHRALPYANRPDGTRDVDAVSIPCSPDELEALGEKIAKLLAAKPFTVTQQVGVKTAEVVIQRKND